MGKHRMRYVLKLHAGEKLASKDAVVDLGFRNYGGLEIIIPSSWKHRHRTNSKLLVLMRDYGTPFKLQPWKIGTQNSY